MFETVFGQKHVVFLVMKIRKNFQYTFQKLLHINLLLIEKEGQFHYIIIKYFSTFMYNQELYRDRKHICHYCFQSFNILERHVNDCFENNSKKMIKISQKDETGKFKTMQQI